MASTFPFKVFCKSFSAFFEPIAAFNCEEAAVNYAGECALANPSFSYRVKRGLVLVREWGPES